MHGDVVEVAHHQHGPALERYSSESRQKISRACAEASACSGCGWRSSRSTRARGTSRAHRLGEPIDPKCDAKKPGPERMGWVVVGPPPVQDEEDVMHEIFDVGAGGAEAPEGAAQVVEFLLERSETIRGRGSSRPQIRPARR